MRNKSETLRRLHRQIEEARRTSGDQFHVKAPVVLTASDREHDYMTEAMKEVEDMLN